MASVSQVVIDLDLDLDLEDGDNKKPNNRSIRELISSLKSTFQAKYLAEVESILLSREEKSQLDISNLKKENELLKEQYEVERLKKLGIQSELKKHKSEIFHLIEKNSRLIEGSKIAILEREKRKAETEVEIWKRRFRELESRILRLEEEIELLMKAEPPRREGFEKNEKNGDLQSTGSRSPSQNYVKISDSDDDYAPGSILSKKDMTSQRPANSAHSGQTGVVNMTKMLKRKPDSCLDTSGYENGDNDDDSSRSGKCKIKKLEESLQEPVGSPVNHGTATAVSSGSNDVGKRDTPSRQDPVILRRCEEKVGAEHDSKSLMSDFLLNASDLSDSEDSSSSSESEGDADMNFDFSQSLFQIQRNRDNRDNKRWNFEPEMLAAFEKDPELCMKAVCALYRQQTSVGNSPRGLLSSNNIGFKKFESCRGTTLAEFLINGDPQGKLKKSVKELLEYDQKGLDDCKRLAIEYSKQLFEIYQNEEDPLFYP